MNNSESSGRYLQYLYGKEFIIVIVIISSAFSFTLGYFVGKKVGNVTPEYTPEDYRQASAPAGKAEDISGKTLQTEKKQTSVSLKSIGTRNEIIYTVQVGAFKNASEAEKFKSKYTKKGYTTFISVAANTGNTIIHKVRIGKLQKKEGRRGPFTEAKKTEGLNTFVTFKN